MAGWARFKGKGEKDGQQLSDEITELINWIGNGRIKLGCSYEHCLPNKKVDIEKIN